MRRQLVICVTFLVALTQLGCPRAHPNPDAGVPPTIFLSVSANPNSVLTAIATVSWTGALASLQVTVEDASSNTRATPSQSLAGQSSPVTVPILPLSAVSPYVLQAIGTDAEGHEWESPPVAFTTGALPMGVPFFEVLDGGMASPGYTLIARIPSASDMYPGYLTIVDGTGAPVWYFAPPDPLTDDFQQQPDGTFTIAQNTDFLQIDVLGNQLRAWTSLDVPDAGLTYAYYNNHEIRQQPDGDFLLFGKFQEQADLTAYGGESDAGLLGDIMERITPTGELTFTWNAFDAVQPADIDTFATSFRGSLIDYTHANSIDVMADGSYLVSLRNFSEVLDIDSTTGDVVWRMGGKEGTLAFVDDPLGGFSCQHAARELPNGDIILFDDGNGHNPPQSRAVEYAIDLTAMTATLKWSSEDNPPLFTLLTGYAQRLSNGNTLIDYGLTLHVQEVDPTGGTVLWDLYDSAGDADIYRAYRLETISPLALTGG